MAAQRRELTNHRFAAVSRDFATSIKDTNGLLLMLVCMIEATVTFYELAIANCHQ